MALYDLWPTHGLQLQGINLHENHLYKNTTCLIAILLLSLSINAHSNESGNNAATLEDFGKHWKFANFPELYADHYAEMKTIRDTADSAVIVLTAEVTEDGRLVDIQVESETPPGQGYADIVKRFVAKGVYAPRGEEKKLGRSRMVYKFGAGQLPEGQKDEFARIREDYQAGHSSH